VINRHDFRDRTVSDERLAALGGTLDRLTAEIRRHAPPTRVFLVDYLTNSAAGRPGHRALPADVAAWGRDVAARPTCSPPELSLIEYRRCSAAAINHQ
jgi:hypothetical protein